MDTATSGTELTIYRVLSFIGLGGAVSDVIALASEYTQMRMRASSVTIFWGGVTDSVMLAVMCGSVG